MGYETDGWSKSNLKDCKFIISKEKVTQIDIVYHTSACKLIGDSTHLMECKTQTLLVE
jgi:hypothetical protein